MSPLAWTPPELEFMRKNYADSLTEDIARALDRDVNTIYAKARVLGLHKSSEFLDGAKSGRLTGNQGASSRFAKGHRPWNDGMKGLQIGGTETQFKPGQRRGTAALIFTGRVVHRIGG
jgi:hypothetical protein